MRYIQFFQVLIVLLFISGLSAQNVMISDRYSPNEPSIMMDPNHPNRLIAASNIANYYISSDTGRTWISATLNSSFGVWGDPVIDVDTAGHFYFFHLSNPPDGSWIDRIVCQKTEDHGATWTDGSFAGLNGFKAQDKHWSAIDPATNTIYLTWTQFDNYGSSYPQDSSSIMFSKSLDAGENWTPAIRINKVNGDCMDSDNTVEGAMPCIGPNGEVYVAWAGPGGIHFDRTLDGGATWLDEDIFVDPMPTGWDYSIPGIYRCNGLPVTKCDVSGGAHHGTIYINWTDQRSGDDNTDVWLAKSTDGGNTWQTPIKVNNDAGNKHQFLTWMDIDQTTGYLYFVFYDRRNYDDNQTDVYMAVSKDGGTTFTNVKISESPFTPSPGVFFGDYNNLVVNDGIIRPIWTRLENGHLSVWTALLNDENLMTANRNVSDSASDLTQYPNPTSDTTYLSFKLRKKSHVKVSLFDAKGVLIKVIQEENMEYGKHIIPIAVSDLGVPSGVYILSLELNGKEKKTTKVVVE